MPMVYAHDLQAFQRYPAAAGEASNHPTVTVDPI